MAIRTNKNSTAPTPVRDYEDHKLTYLSMIQSIINRMAGNSAIMKGFAATIMAAMLGMVASGNVEWYYYFIALVPLGAFVVLDFFYLSMERRYINLYALIADPTIYIRHNYALSLKASCYSEYSDRLKENADVKSILKSISIWGYYPWFAVMSTAIILINIFS